MRSHWVGLGTAAIFASVAATRMPAAPRAELAGCVIDLATGNAVPGAWIKTVPDDGNGVHSDSIGYFALILGTDAPRSVGIGRIGYGSSTALIDSTASGKINAANVALTPLRIAAIGPPPSYSVSTASFVPDARAAGTKPPDTCQRRLTAFGGKRAPMRGPVYVEGCIAELDSRIPSVGVVVTLRSDTAITDATGYFGLIGASVPGFDSVTVAMPSRRAQIGIQIPESRRAQVGTITRDPTPGDTARPKAVVVDRAAGCKERINNARR